MSEGKTEDCLIIKRYSNRKLYDTSQSRYITLIELGEIVHSGVNIQVIDNRTKEDLTQITLAQVLIAQQKKGRGGLRKLVQDQAEILIHRLSTPVQHIRDGAMKQVGRLTKKGEAIKGVEEETLSASERRLQMSSNMDGSAGEKLVALLLMQRIDSLEEELHELRRRVEALEMADDARY
ncbi:MAG: polyhydroxyalkanoate synthesis regulator DNA-binding domain-containing protein [Bradymonadales bacterium]